MYRTFLDFSLRHPDPYRSTRFYSTLLLMSLCSIMDFICILVNIAFRDAIFVKLGSLRSLTFLFTFLFLFLIFILPHSLYFFLHSDLPIWLILICRTYERKLLRSVVIERNHQYILSVTLQLSNSM